MGGIGRGALAVRYALAATEYRQENHRAGTYFSFNGTAPSPEEHTELAVLGGWPRLPQKLKLVAGDVAGDLGDEDFDDITTAPADSGGLLIPAAQTSWLLDHLAA
ncbi:hypothetical protein M8Z33_24190 [Streptomyces sp. ZAF1911]|uniref:hypothetical protein n=1 Tax=Streptomyces sp. ZAF1911 TaxID=2944129 RepID=UPI00237C47C0|nr:hypothetical protein [Streptomyces sp. ZAF1911]MDD9379700.1 hypothetical protein [Streptomyces sp. ZAF1911]